MRSTARAIRWYRSPADPPPQPPRIGSGAGGGRTGGFPRWLLFGGLGVAVTAAIITTAIVAITAIGGNGDNGGGIQVVVPAPTATAMPTYTPYPTPTTRPTDTPMATATPRPTYTPYPRLSLRPTDTPIPEPSPTPLCWHTRTFLWSSAPPLLFSYAHTLERSYAVRSYAPAFPEVRSRGGA